MLRRLNDAPAALQADTRNRDEFKQQASALAAAGRELHARGMVPATSGNFSARLSDGNILITVSGCHKGRLDPSQLMLLDSNGRPQDERRPSAETALHLLLYRRLPRVGAVLHTHSVNATVLSMCRDGHVELAGYELLKALPGITSHEASVTLPTFDNDQDIDALAGKLARYLDEHPLPPACLIRGHGSYCWGDSVDTALQTVEALEFLFQCKLMEGNAP